MLEDIIIQIVHFIPFHVPHFPQSSQFILNYNYTHSDTFRLNVFIFLFVIVYVTERRSSFFSVLLYIFSCSELVFSFKTNLNFVLTNKQKSVTLPYSFSRCFLFQLVVSNLCFCLFLCFLFEIPEPNL